MWVFQGKNANLVKLYQQYRQVSNQLVDRVMRSPSINETRLMGAFKALGVLRGKQVLLEHASEEAATMDFIFHDYRPDGKSLVQCYSEVVEDLTPQEQTVLQGWLAGYTSLFKVKQVSTSNKTVDLQNLLTPETEDISLIDLNLSRSVPPGTLLFTRVIPLPELKMSSGSTFAFKPETEKQVLSRYKNFSKKVKPEDELTQRYICFFKLNRTHGLAVNYR